MKKKLLSKGCNRKLAKDVGVLNLPRGITCPGKTPVCDSVCYANKAERMYKSARDSRQANLVLSRRPDFDKQLIQEVHSGGYAKVRLHESGDVYNQEYLDKLIRAVRGCPKTKFLMYSKSFHLDWSAAPDNLVIYWSVDPSTPRGKIPAKGRYAHLVLKGGPIPAGTKTCVHTSPRHYCGSECTTCWDGDGDVYFIQH